ncbi:hypothetical protein AX774_g4396 [Zancudomyces culisetae]|uniref:Uncharacterized protein n=1 Tax=Zancudomyces culisetae TaxID=1213189 RepID=A0A1R1PMF2_ZANCU|nr:hypothetical protein AX774_g4396 [Zancudomyces culisetae]|eukprot:OMH82126.1 hypothetical protein AX774_g4396 [Zancudomyces culisetae]
MIPSYKNEIYQLCTGSQHEELQKVYRESKYKTRKIILCSTALSEKIEGVRHVIDTGLQKTRKYHYETDTEVVEVGFISKKIADHRSSFARQKDHNQEFGGLYTYIKQRTNGLCISKSIRNGFDFPRPTLSYPVRSLPNTCDPTTRSYSKQFNRAGI